MIFETYFDEGRWYVTYMLNELLYSCDTLAQARKRAWKEHRATIKVVTGD